VIFCYLFLSRHLVGPKKKMKYCLQWMHFSLRFYPDRRTKKRHDTRRTIERSTGKTGHDPGYKTWRWVITSQQIAHIKRFESPKLIGFFFFHQAWERHELECCVKRSHLSEENWTRKRDNSQNRVVCVHPFSSLFHVTTLANHKGHRQPREPIKTYM